MSSLTFTLAVKNRKDKPWPASKKAANQITERMLHYHGIDTKPLVNTYRRHQLKYILEDFMQVEVKIVHFKRNHLPGIGAVLPPIIEGVLEPFLGGMWFPFAKNKPGKSYSS